MTPKEAAEVIGCTPHHVRVLIRKGTIRATKQFLPSGGYVYIVNTTDVESHAAKTGLRGWPRGVARKQQNKTKYGEG